MRVFQIEGEWGIANLRLSTRPTPTPGPSEVLLRPKASSLNWRDLVVLDRGYGAFTGTLPLIPVSDCAAEVVEIGAGVTRVAVGDRVMPAFFPGWIAGEPDPERLTRSYGGPLDGTMTERMCVAESGLVKVPAYLTDLEASTLPCAGVTAWSALSGTRPGDRVLVQGTGGVALFALSIAKAAGAQVTVISSSDEKIARAKALGADAAINYRSVPEWGKATREITQGRGYDRIIELGGEKTLPQSLRCIRPGGVIVLIGVLSGSALNVPLGIVVTRQVRLQGITVGTRDDFEALLRAMVQHTIHPVVDRVFDFEALKDALAYLKSGAHFGKISIQHG